MPAVSGAAYVPVVEVPLTVPPVEVQITFVLGVFWSVAVSVKVLPATTVALDGDTATASPGILAAATTVIVEDEVRVPLTAVAI